MLDSTDGTEPIEQALEAMGRETIRLFGAKASAPQSPRRRLAFWQATLKAMRTTDLAHCPPPFQQAFAAHVQDLQAWLALVQRHPQFQGKFAGVLRRIRSNPSSPRDLDAALAQSEERLDRSAEALSVVAARYHVTFRLPSWSIRTL